MYFPPTNLPKFRRSILRTVAGVEVFTGVVTLPRGSLPGESTFKDRRSIKQNVDSGSELRGLPGR